MMKMRTILLLAALMSTMGLRAQFAVIGSADNTFTPEQLIEEVCLGEGLEVTNIEFQGVDRAVGRFSGGQNVIGLDEGFLMTTGLAQSMGNIAGADRPSALNSSFVNNSTAFTPELLLLANELVIRDVAIFHIDFVPSGDSIMFRYVFASDEYPEFVCSSFNDVFGFFLEGPDPATGQNVQTNLANIPGTNLPVSINSVNNGLPGSYPGGHPAFCTEALNGSLDYAEFFNVTVPMNFPTYNGYTDVFVAKSAVVPCATYRMTLVIADVGDAYWDSGIFFEAQSFCSFGDEGHGGDEELPIAASCLPQSLSFDLSGFSEAEYPLAYTITALTENGEAIPGLPESGQIDSPDWAWPAALFADSLPQGLTGLNVLLQGGECREKTYSLPIVAPVSIQGPADVQTCDSEPVTLSADIPAELLPAFELRWSNGETGAAITVSPQQTTTYTLFYGNALGECTAEYTVAVSPQETLLSATITEGETYLLGNEQLSAAGEYERSFLDANGCDSLVRLTLKVIPVSETRTDSIAVGQTQTLCVDTQIFQSVASFANPCGSTAADFSLDPVSACASYTGLQPGIDTACLIACNDMGLCDTTYLILSVFNNLLEAVDDYDTTLYDQPITLHVLANDWISSTVLTDQYIVDSAAYGSLTLNADGSIHYAPDLAACLQEDVFRYAICNDIGCDTATVYLFLDETDGQCGLVWPGDVGNDGLVNQMDQWAIGLAYGRSGPVRPNATLDWVGQEAIDWPGTITFAYEFNQKYADCNGDGAINANDMEAIQLNWGKTHPVTPFLPQAFPERAADKQIGAPQQEGSALAYAIELGTAQAPLTNAYGLSFELHFDPIRLLGLSFEASEGAFQTEGSELLVLAHLDSESGRALVSLVRTDQQGVDALGHLGTLRLEFDYPAEHFDFELRNWHFLQADGQVFELPGALSAPQLSSTAEAALPGLRAYPTPARDQLWIESPVDAQASLQSADGRTLWQGVLRTGTNELATGQWPTGLYVLKVQAEGQLAWRKILITR